MDAQRHLASVPPDVTVVAIMRGLIAIHRLAGAFGVELRVVVPAGLMGVFTMGLDAWLPIYPTLPAALASS